MLAAAGVVAIYSAAALLGPAVAGTDVDQAETLFRQGKSLLAKRDYEHACPLLAQSFALDPGTGTLLALAICYEGQGKLASAADTYGRAAERAVAEGRADREEVARERAASLAPRLSTIAIVPPETTGAGENAPTPADLVIKRDGALVPSDAWGTPVAVDGGSHLIEVSAVGKRSWQTTVTVAPAGQQKIVAVPALADLAPVAVAEPATRTDPATSAADRGAAPLAARAPPQATDSIPQVEQSASAPSGSPLRIAGLALMAGGVAGLVVGGGYALHARNKYQDSLRGCQNDDCTDPAYNDRLAAISAGNVATIFTISGAVVAAAGATLFLIARPNAAPAKAVTPVGGGLAVTRGGAIFMLEGSLAP